MRIFAIVKRILAELLRDKRSLALMLLAPILIMWLMNIMFSANSDTKIKLAAVDVPQIVQKNLEKTSDVSIVEYSSQTVAKEKLQENKIDALIVYREKANTYNVTYTNTDATKTALTKQALNVALTKEKITGLSQAIQKLEVIINNINPTSTKSLFVTAGNKTKINSYYKYGNSDTNFFNKIVPILMGFFVFFFVFLISGMALLRERTSGTLDRLLATPVKRSEIVFGYLISYGMVSIVQTTIIVLATIWLLKIEVVGSILSIILISVLLAMVALAFGILMSTLAGSEFQMMQFIPLVVVPQIFFSGIIPLDSMATWVQYIGKVLPLTYTGDALTKIIMYGDGLNQLIGDIIALLIFLLVLVALNVVGLKRYRKV
ncbi:ABC transporter permease [Ligilactobacillus sp. WILCCON 0076]|uniref:ABC transporter permease n=1 Tax=Ligilactobacillus ubinensis TaxID=2876789 RepID=A0A9X2FK09_9LACO|nr:ABC transporter permease [Ligilactobacillus ubinensis]MCP0886614.1 ABC transporter permease [Ligilactobacillus ubinensis]